MRTQRCIHNIPWDVHPLRFYSHSGTPQNFYIVRVHQHGHMDAWTVHMADIPLHSHSKKGSGTVCSRSLQISGFPGSVLVLSIFGGLLSVVGKRESDSRTETRQSAPNRIFAIGPSLIPFSNRNPTETSANATRSIATVALQCPQCSQSAIRVTRVPPQWRRGITVSPQWPQYGPYGTHHIAGHHSGHRPLPHRRGPPQWHFLSGKPIVTTVPP